MYVGVFTTSYLYPCLYLCIWILDLHMHPEAGGGWKEGAGLFVPELSSVLSCQTGKAGKTQHMQSGPPIIIHSNLARLKITMTTEFVILI